MKKALMAIFCMMLINTAFANDGFAQLGIKISGPDKSNAQFLCIYDVGCLSIKAGNKGDVFPVADGDMANLNKFVIADMNKEKMTFEQSPSSCGVQLTDNQKMTVEGRLVVTSKGTEIQDLHCTVNTVKATVSDQQT